MSRKAGPTLSVVTQQPGSTVPAPPGKLDGAGRDLWAAVLSNYEFADPASHMVLYQSCSAIERAERCRDQIDEDGEMLRVGKTVRSHPLLRDEVANRALACRLLQKLGLDLEPIRGIGRPPGGFA